MAYSLESARFQQNLRAIGIRLYSKQTPYYLFSFLANLITFRVCLPMFTLQNEPNDPQ